MRYVYFDCVNGSLVLGQTHVSSYPKLLTSFIHVYFFSN